MQLIPNFPGPSIGRMLACWLGRFEPTSRHGIGGIYGSPTKKPHDGQVSIIADRMQPRLCPSFQSSQLRRHLSSAVIIIVNARGALSLVRCSRRRGQS